VAFLVFEELVMSNKFKSGITVGNGAAINIECGFIPDLVHVLNATDGDLITCAFANDMVIPFSSGGTTEIAVGGTITGATSGATAVISQVLLYSGTWAGGDAAGFFVAKRQNITGTFGSENVDVGTDTNQATVTVQVAHSFSISGDVASATGNDAVSAYVGSTSNSEGFTIGSSVAEEAKLLRWAAWRDG
jgi:hypothetical protein